MTWKKGQSGNPAGRKPKGDSWAEILREMADGPVPDELKGASGDTKTLRQAVAHKLFALALDGDSRAIKELFERCDGRAPQASELSTMEPEAPSIDPADLKDYSKEELISLATKLSIGKPEPIVMLHTIVDRPVDEAV